ncbi:MAG: NINE protein [Deltaproteobacteria bacterium]|nr:NINE protein [Deltaproteobacteria bacterium]
MRTKETAAVLAFFLGSLGGHRFYLGQTFQGLPYLLFSWSFIPAILSLFEFVDASRNI